MMQPLIADGGELTVLRSLASHAWGQWQVEWPESVPEDQRPQLADDREQGYVAALERQVGRMGRRFVRADVTVTAAERGPDGVMLPHSGASDVEEQLDAAATRTDGDAFFEREITREGLGPLVPYSDFDVGDVVPVSIWGRVMEQPVMSIEAVSEAGAVVDWRVNVGGELLADDAARRRANEELERAIAQERRERAKSVRAVDSKVTGAQKTASEAKQTADSALRAAHLADGKSTTFFGSSTPVGGKAGDTWFRDMPDGTVAVYQFLNGVWSVRVDQAKWQSQLDAAKADVEKARQSVANLESTVLPALDAELDAAQKQVADVVGTQLPSLRGQVSTLSTTLAAEQQARTAAINAAKAELAAADATLTKSLADAETRLKAADAAVKTEVSQKAAADLAAAKLELSTSLADAEARLKAADTAVKTEVSQKAAADLAGLKATLEAADKKLTGDVDAARAVALSAGLMEPGNLVWNPRGKNNMDGWTVNTPLSAQFFNTGGKTLEFVRITWSGTPVTKNVDFGYTDRTKYITIAPGQEFLVRLWVRPSVALPAGALRLFPAYMSYATSPALDAGVWTQVEGVVKADAQNTYPHSFFRVQVTTAVPQDAQVDICNPFMVEAAGDYLVVDGSISADKLAANAVTAGKVAAGTINTRELVAGAVTTDVLSAGAVNASKVVAGSITGDRLATNTITTRELKAGAVTATEIAAGAVTATQLAVNAVAAINIVAGSITGDRLAANTVTAREVKAGSLTANELAAGSVTATQLSAGSVQAGSIAAGAVVADKLAASAVTGDKISANAIGARELAANSVSTQHLTVSPGNLFPDPHFKDPSWGTGGQVYAASSNGGELRFFPNGTQQGRYYQPGGLIDASMVLEPGAQYRLSASMWANADGAKTGTVSIYARFFNKQSTKVIRLLGSIPVGGQYTSQESMTLTAPTDMNDGTCTIGFFVEKTANGGQVSMWNVQLVRAADASLIVDGSVLAQHIGAGQVVAGNLAAEAVTAGTLAAGAVTTRSIGAGQVTATEIAAGTITADNIKSASVTSDKLVIENGFIKNAMIADAAVTSAKIASLDAGKITTGTLSADRLAADSITVRELKAGTIVPLGTQLIVSEPAVSGGTPEPIWWAAAPNELAADYPSLPRPEGNPWRTAPLMGARTSSVPPKRLVKVEPDKAYKLRFWAYASAADTRMFIEMRDQDGVHAVQEGAVSGTPTSTEGDGGGLAYEGYTGSTANNFLVNNWIVPTKPTLVESTIRFKPGVKYVYLKTFYFNHQNGSGVGNQWLAGLSLALDAADQAAVDRAQDEQNQALTQRVDSLQKWTAAIYNLLSSRLSALETADMGWEVFRSSGTSRGVTVNTGYRGYVEFSGSWIGEAIILKLGGLDVLSDKVSSSTAYRFVVGGTRQFAVDIDMDDTIVVLWRATPGRVVSSGVSGTTNTVLPRGAWTALHTAVAPAGATRLAASIWAQFINVNRGSLYGLRVTVNGNVVASWTSTTFGPLGPLGQSTWEKELGANVDVKAGNAVAFEAIGDNSTAAKRTISKYQIDVAWNVVDY